jgi:hypothetical protein
LMQYIKNGEQEIPDFFKEVIEEKHARVWFHKRFHIRWKILNSKFAPSRETNRLLKDVVGILNVCIFLISFFWCLPFFLKFNYCVLHFIYRQGLIKYLAILLTTLQKRFHWFL